MQNLFSRRETLENQDFSCKGIGSVEMLLDHKGGEQHDKTDKNTQLGHGGEKILFTISIIGTIN